MPDVGHLQPYIYTILSAQDVDLASISAKRVRKQLLEDGSADPDFVKDNKDDIDTLIAEVFQRVSLERNFSPDDDDEQEHEPDADEHEHDDQPSTPVPAPAKSSTKRRRGSDANDGSARAQKRREPATDRDEEYARRLQEEINPPKRSSRSGAASGRATKPKTKAKANGAGGKRGKPKKSAETVDDDDEDEGAPIKKKRGGGGGFQKPYQLSEPLVAVINETQLARPQVVKALWGYIKENNLQNPSDKREILCDDKLRALFKADKVTMFSMNKELSKHLIDPANA